MYDKAAVLSSSSDAVRFEVRLERFGNKDAPICLLPGFNEGDKEPGQRGAAPIENMGQDILSGGILKPQVHATRLKIFTIGATGHFQVLPLPWRPYFDIERFGAGESHVARAEVNYAVMQAEHLENALGMSYHLVQYFVAALRVDDLDQLDFIELMHPYHSASADAGGAGFCAEAGTVGAIINRQLGFFEDFFAMNVRDWSLGGGQEL